ncbi:MAG: ATP-dependent helicase [Desulfobacterales bacterium CG2_30_60_27]|nr:MAG: ATP-dependent helicase [Desulfobacterales bacterium CG2_30_60_27]
MTHTELEAVVMPDGTIQLEWSESPDKASNATDVLRNAIFAQYSADPDNWLLYLGFCRKHPQLSPSLEFWRSFAGLFTQKLRLTPEIEQQRGRVAIPLDADELREISSRMPLMTGSEYVGEDQLRSLWQLLHHIFSRQITSFTGTVEEFIKGCNPEIHVVGRIYFHLVENRHGADPFAFLATYSTALNAEGESKHLPLKYALEEYRNDTEKLLQLLVNVSEAARQSELINDLLESGELFAPLSWSTKEAYTFLQEIELYEDCGILCRIPNWWKGQTARIGVNISIGEKAPSMVGMAALLDFRPRLMIGDAEISEEEARRLLRESEGLAFIKNKWVAVDPDKLRQTLAAYEKARELGEEEGLSFLDAMRFSMNPEKVLGAAEATAIAGVSHGEWLRVVMEKLHHPEEITKVAAGPGFKAKLRGYQQQGLQWLCLLHTLRLGACLADDMGLGKTIQILAFLHVLKGQRAKQPGRASLLVLPASLLSNWISEINAFAPDLVFFAAHPDFHKPQPVPTLRSEQLDAMDLVITTYALVQRYTWLGDYPWHAVILDEAQAIKNPGAKQTKAVKGLTAATRIVMTGTPIENRMSDLWSLFDFVNPGLLGTAKEFTAFSKGLAETPAGYAGLRRVISPFILRRMKTDKSIISDLPDKVEVKTWASLGKKQALLYAEIIESIKASLAETEGIQRKGLILSALMKFKQLCNHPSQYLGLDVFDEHESGKFERLREICETIHEKREKVLVFTQFKEMTGPLSRFLARIFQREGLVLHGGVPVGKRKDLVARFQGHDYVPFFVLSLKAGGVGLNLTAANHVIHFDRWWNPAVENQATDRAFRIGQKKNVMVHKFLTKGTIEEKIDAMLERKLQLTNDIIAPTGENWITEMSNEELLDLFTLNTLQAE